MDPLTDKTILITGATNGIGRASAEKLAQMGANIIIVGRSVSRCRDVVEGILRNQGKAEFLSADLSSIAQVRQLARQFQDQYTRLDVLLNNAGAYFSRRQVSPDGFELTFALNHLSYFLITNLLLDILNETAVKYGEARIVNVASGAHFGGKIDFSDLQSNRAYSKMGFDAYSNSKLANVLFTFELARRLQGTSVTVNALHPGFVASGFGLNNFQLMRLAMKLLGRFALTPEEGAQTSIYLASSPEVRAVSGKYFDKCKPVEAAPQAYDQEVQKKLWEISEQLVNAH
jgi:retinol dehydrogenase-12